MLVTTAIHKFGSAPILEGRSANSKQTYSYFRPSKALTPQKVYSRSHVKKIYGRSIGINLFFFFFFFSLSAKPEIVVPGPGIRFRNFIFEISGKPSFVEAVLWVAQFFYLLCFQFQQKTSGWINKTLLLIKQQKWLSEFCVKIVRIARKN